MFEKLLKLNRILMRSAAGLLVVVGAVKIISAYSGVAYLSHFDPVLSFLTNRTLLLLAGGVEIGVAVIIFLRPQSWGAGYGLLSLCFMFSIYRFGRVALGVHPPCPCLGRASDWLHITPHAADNVALSLLIVFSLSAITSFAVQTRLSVSRKRSCGRI
jgi:Methylamine utilisation protein MauE